ncbi:MAG: 30S ribosomal protein S18 [Deltaproteobacteria bacterium]|nr:30S ribosomal protein S18 [Deltaproteobacteria bacterium]
MRPNNFDRNGNTNGKDNFRKKKKRNLLRKKRTLDPALIIDYKNPDVLRRFVTDRGKIIPRRISGATQEQQRKLAVAIKRARFLSLLPYSISHDTERGYAGELQNIIQTFVSASMRTRGPMRGDGPRRERDDRPERSEKPDQEQEEEST